MRHAILVVLAAALSGCSGQIADGPSAEASGDVPSPAGGGATSGGSTPNPPAKPAHVPAGPASPMTPNWSLHFTGPGANAPTAIAPDASSNAYVVGWFSQSIGTPCGDLAASGDYDAYVVKMGAQGECLWATRFGGSSYTYASAAATEGADVYVAGSFRYDATVGSDARTGTGWLDGFVTKIHGDGTIAWVRTFGGPNDDEPQAITVSGGQVIVAGRFFGTTTI